MTKKSTENRKCPMCEHSEFTEISENFIQCDNCKVLIDFKNHKLHVTQCPLCDSKDLIPLPSGNIRCRGCNNSFVACKMDD